MAPSLPHHPDLERFRRDARRLQRAVRSGDARALALARRFLPDPITDPAEFPLTAAQFAVARGYGFASWPKLRDYLRVAGPLSRDTSAAPAGTAADRFVAHACLVYDRDDGPERWAVAREVLAAHPALPQEDPYAAATLGDVAALRAHLERDPGVARREGGPFRWTPLFCLAYSRVLQQDPVASARALLDAGADPAAGYLWQGLPTPFTVLTGCFGEGEQGPGRQPRHPAEQELAGLLLDRGADPNDAQTLYNRMFGRDDSHLQILLARGLGAGDGGVWQRRLGEALETPAEMVSRHLDWAREHGFTDRVQLLADHGFAGAGTDADPSPWRSRKALPPIASAGTPGAVRALAAAGGDLGARWDGRTALHHLAWIGDVEMVRALLESGADPDLVDDEYGTTPLAWAEYAHAEATAVLLRPVTGRHTGE